jgi:hypothetical protein
VSYVVQASPDGQTWQTIHGPTAEQQATILLPYVPGGGSGWRVRVQANDGLKRGCRRSR